MIALASLLESARKIALDRFRLLQPHLEEKRPLKAVARDPGIGYRTAQRWVMRYRKCGLAGLARNDRADRGRRRTLTPALKEILEALALQKPPLPIAALHRHLCRIAVERGQPLVPEKMACPESGRLPYSRLFRARSTRSLQLCHRKRCAPSRGEWLLRAANLQNSDALKFKSIPTRNVPLQQDYVQSGGELRYGTKFRPTSVSHSALWLAQSLPPWSFGRKLAPRDATWKTPQSTDKRRRE
jgi:hypothetical protein